jgi:hypothetical protein
MSDTGIFYDWDLENHDNPLEYVGVLSTEPYIPARPNPANPTRFDTRLWNATARSIMTERERNYQLVAYQLVNNNSK